MSMLTRLNRKQLLFGFAIFALTVCVYGGESSTCLMVYKDGGAPAVFQSPKCPRWNLPSYGPSPPRKTGSDVRCQSAMLQGRRKYQEDRTLCALDVRIPFPGKFGLKEVTVDIVAVFDGHNGAEASEMASKLLLEYFALHTYFLLDASYSVIMKKTLGTLLNTVEADVVFQVLNWKEDFPKHELNPERFKFSLPSNFDDSFHFEILKEALLRAIHDIDATFSKEASRNHLASGSTANIALIVDGKILVANVGDSKSLLCSDKYQSDAEARATFLRSYLEQRRHGLEPFRRKHNKLELASNLVKTHLVAEELTQDHHPDRPDERLRVESSGGYVVHWGGVSRVNGQLAVSRAIGDVHFRSYGIVSTPEVTDWRPLTTNDSYLVVASDGIFEKLSLQDVCDILREVNDHDNGKSELYISCPYSLAECLTSTAFEKGSTDNMAAIVVPLQSKDLLRESCVEEGAIYCSTMVVKNFKNTQSAVEITSDLGHSKNEVQPLIAKFDRLLIEGKKNHKNGCYYLFERVQDYLDVSGALGNDQENYTYIRHEALPSAFNHFSGGHLNLYNDQSMCLHLGMTADEAKDQCFSSEGFSSFLGLLESIPFYDASSNYETEYASPSLRYVLKKRFGRGAYGEVWLAFHWNCHQANNTSRWNRQTKVSNDDFFNTYSSNNDCNEGLPDNNLYILKRIMVERGAAVYLSGLREKYFGEIFLNASRRLEGTASDEGVASIISDFYFQDMPNTSNSAYDSGNSWSFQNYFSNKFRLKSPFEEGLNHIARYVESFESRSGEIWLVFRHEGVSLSKLMYTIEEVENKTDKEESGSKYAQLLHPSNWWHWLKTTAAGQEEMRNLIWQLLMGLKSCHDRNITHRDIKPENMIICLEDQDTGKCLHGIPNGWKNYTTKMRIIDFGSAIDDFTVKHLYGSSGPSRAEQTHEYAPPEGFLNVSWCKGPTRSNLKYDMWSVGVVMLELILGSPNVFQISSLTRALLDPHINGWNEELKELAYKLRSFMELCILIPGSPVKQRYTVGRAGASPASWKCSEEAFSHQIKSRDPQKIGFPNVRALRLVCQLLLWDPDDRLSVDDALRHPYFQHPPE